MTFTRKQKKVGVLQLHVLVGTGFILHAIFLCPWSRKGRAPCDMASAASGPNALKESFSGGVSLDAPPPMNGILAMSFLALNFHLNFDSCLLLF